MKHLFVPYEIAKKLEEKGFNEKCIAHHVFEQPDNNYVFQMGLYFYREVKPNYTLAPTHQQCVDWFREKHNIFAFVKTDIIHGSELHTGMILGKTKPIEVFCESSDYYDTYNKLIEESLKLI